MADESAYRDMTEYWDTRYREGEQIWSGRANAELVREATELAPGRALDLGCGEGGDAIWLASRGWRVTAADISAVALERAARHAAAAGVGDRVTWERHDLAVSFPAGEFDLVSAQYLHSWEGLPRERILRAAAGAVAPGGILLVTGHSGTRENEGPHGHGTGHSHDAGHEHGPGHEHGAEHDHGSARPAIHLPTPAEVLDGLRLADGAWEILRAEEHEPARKMPSGHQGDNTVKLRRR